MPRFSRASWKSGSACSAALEATAPPRRRAGSAPAHAEAVGGVGVLRLRASGRVGRRSPAPGRSSIARRALPRFDHVRWRSTDRPRPPARTRCAASGSRAGIGVQQSAGRSAPSGVAGIERQRRLFRPQGFGGRHRPARAATARSWKSVASAGEASRPRPRSTRHRPGAPVPTPAARARRWTGTRSRPESASLSVRSAGIVAARVAAIHLGQRRFELGPGGDDRGGIRRRRIRRRRRRPADVAERTQLRRGVGRERRGGPDGAAAGSGVSRATQRLRLLAVAWRPGWRRSPGSARTS